MSDNDLIRRGDALNIHVKHGFRINGEIYMNLHETVEAIKNIPAVPRVMTAREYLETEERMCKQCGIPTSYDLSGFTIDEAIEMIAKFARENPKEDQ